MIATAVGIDDHPWRGQRPSSAPVAQFDPPAGRDDPRVTDAIERWGLGEKGLERMTTSLTCATDGHFKLLLRGDHEELYDLESDPLETNPQNAHRGPPQQIAKLRQAIAEADAIGGEHSSTIAKSAPSSDTDTQDLEARMRLLGYL